MREIKKGKTIEIIHRLVAKFVQDISSPASLITITRVELSMTGKEAKAKKLGGEVICQIW